ncbi:EAL domain-containing protein [Isoptericola sp. b441]|uniref:EAL domain-containing protein n=1 Tax=Actinotalea lenta TaxID=3064654 RepID=A0ABT9D7Y5_9CELL|nr:MULTISPECIES: EAL domain-containing protein [unclassified Isoptericola]MDO8106985.1 EAL domain-containing protein [Isoptericola sp. b441]MDO8121305.1 EAL domain-containing protein [Isoptericola sp. b490]
MTVSGPTLVDPDGAPRLVRRLEPWTLLALAVHAVAVEAVSSWSVEAVAAIAVLGVLGGLGLAGWQSRSAVLIRFVSVLTLTFLLMAHEGPGAGYFLLWSFVIAAVYPLVLAGRVGVLAVVAVPVAYLGLVPLGAADGPWQVSTVRAVALLLIGLVVHAATDGFRAAAAQRAEAMAVLDAFADTMPVGMTLLDLGLRFRRVNPVFAQLCDVSSDALLDRPAEDLAPSVPGLVHHLERVRDGHQAPPLEVHSAGRWWTLQIFPVTGPAGRIGVGVAAIDITAQRESARALAHSATHDSLTGLPNRALFGDRLGMEVARAARRGEPIAVLFCDLDRFKDLNDSLGHAAGDELLRVAGERLAAAVRTGDTVARLGGDEFAVLCTEVADTAAAVAVGERIRELLREPMRIGSRDVTATMSIGLTAGIPHVGAAQQLLADADVAMYAAKDAGRDRVVVFDAEHRTGARQRFEVHAALRGAVERGEISVAYQPIVDLGTHRVTGLEALARWNRGGAPVSPSVFIPMAEDLGLIEHLGNQVARRATEDVQRWRAELYPDLVVSVNLSVRQLAVPGSVRALARLLDESGLAPTALRVEVTESALMADVAAGVERLDQLRELGVRIALDDFGTGYSSLALLRDLPVDVIKIDRSFAQRLPDETAMVAFIVDLARTIGATTVVEGVETPEQLAVLAPLGCDAVQGFLLGRPTSADAVPALLADGPAWPAS